MVDIYSLDLSTQTGWAAGDAGAHPVSGSVRIGRPDMNLGQFGVWFEDWLTEQIKFHKPQVLSFEAPILTAGKTSVDVARKLMGLAFVTEIVGTRCGIKKIFECHTGEVTKFLTGKGAYQKSRALKKTGRDLKKMATIEGCRRMGWNPKDADEADALAVFRWTEHCVFPKAREHHGDLWGTPI